VSYYDAQGATRETTALTREAAEAKAEALVDRLQALCRAPLAASTVSDLAAEYMGRYADKKEWSYKYREERRYAYRWLPGWFVALPCLDWRVQHTEDVLRAVEGAGYPRGCEEYRRVGALLSGLRTAGLLYGYLPRGGPDPLEGVRYNPERGRKADRGTGERAALGNVRPVAEDLIPDGPAVLSLAACAAERTGCWWEGLRVRLMAGGGLRFGEQADLRAPQVSTEPDSPWVHVVRQAVVVTRRAAGGGPTLLLGQPPKGGAARHAFYDPELVPLLERRRAEVGPEGLLLPSPSGSVWRASNYMRDVWGPCARDLGWARVEDLTGRPPGSKASGWLWTPHSLRHRYATWLIRELAVPVYSVAEWCGHSDVGITQRMYVDTSRPDVSAGVRAVRAARP
jgi:integrase